MTLTSLEFVLSRFRILIEELGFEATETGFEKMKKELMDYHRRGFRYRKRQLIIPRGNDIYSGEIQRRCISLFSLYNQMISFEEETDFLDNFY